MEGEVGNLVTVWAWIIANLSYCYVIGKIVPKGNLRLLLILPVVFHFVLLPRKFTSVHFSGTIGFWLGWLANFKLLLFAFGTGPLAADPSCPLHRFVALAFLPVKVRQVPPEKESIVKAISGWLRSLGTKLLLVFVFVRLQDYIHTNYDVPQLLVFLSVFQMYFSLEISLDLIAGLARGLVQMDMEPQFDSPYLSTSLQEFWGRRWNLTVTNIMRPTVYDPIRRWTAPAVGRKAAKMLATLGTFGVSAVMHELVLHYLTRQQPTGEISLFFVLHGVLLVLEVELKNWWYAVSDWRLPEVVSRLLAVGFMIVTGMYMFLPYMLRFKVDVRSLEEMEAFSTFLRSLTRGGSIPLNATV